MTAFIKQLTKFTLVLLLFFGVFTLSYWYFDPFKVLHRCDTFYHSNQPNHVTLNNDYVAIETFLMNHPTYNYNSFIIGNSRSRFYEIKTWRKYIQSDKCFHFDASSESLFGISKKMDFLHEQRVDIRHALIILDYSTLAQTRNSKGYLFIKHPLLSGQNKYNFQLDFFRIYGSFTFLSAFADFKISGNMKEYMKISGLETTPMEYDVKCNEMRLTTFENMIKNDAATYYNAKRMTRFQPRDTVQQFSPKVIGIEQIALLNKIKNIFSHHATHYKIVISPLFDQIKLHPKDIQCLKTIFGETQVYDFSGINAITSDYHNYYENSHYRPLVADSIMAIVYADTLRQ